MRKQTFNRDGSIREQSFDQVIDALRLFHRDRTRTELATILTFGGRSIDGIKVEAHIQRQGQDLRAMAPGLFRAVCNRQIAHNSTQLKG